MTPRKSWKRWPNEPDAAYALFSEWLQCTDTEGDRTDVYSWAAGRAETAEWRSFIMQCQDVYKWASRATDHDAYRNASTVRKVYPLMSPLLLSLYRIALTEVRKYEKAQEQSGDAPGFIDWRAVLKTIDIVLKYETKVKEFALKEKEILRDIDPSVLLADFSKITVEEHRMLDAIMAKAVDTG